MSHEAPVEKRIEKLFEDNGIPDALVPFCKGYRKGTKKNPITNVVILNWGKEVEERSYTKANVFHKKAFLREEDLIDIDNIVLKDMKSVEDIVALENYFVYDFFLRPMKKGFYNGIRKIWPSKNEVDTVKIEWRKESENEEKVFEKDLKKSVKMFKSVMEIAKPNLVIILGNTLKKIVEHGLGEKFESSYKETIFVVVPYSYYEIAETNNEFAIVFALAGINEIKKVLKKKIEKEKIKKKESEIEKIKKNLNSYIEKKYPDYWFPLSSVLKDEFIRKGSFSYKMNLDKLENSLKWVSDNLLAKFFPEPIAQGLVWRLSQLTKCVDIMLEKNIPKPADDKAKARTAHARKAKAEKKEKAL